MRAPWICLVVLTACGDSAPAVDASTPFDSGPDATLEYCTSGAGTANVTASDGGRTNTFGRLHAGAYWFIPVAPVDDPLNVWLVLTNSSEPVDVLTANYCLSATSECRAIDGVAIAFAGALAGGEELGSHPVHIRDFHAAFELDGTATITEFARPLDSLGDYVPGRIAGSVSGSSGGTTVSGTFDNSFCKALVGPSK